MTVVDLKAEKTRGAEKKFQEISHFTSRQLVLHMRSEEMKHYLISIMAEILEGHVDEKLDAIDDRLTAHGENHEMFVLSLSSLVLVLTSPHTVDWMRWRPPTTPLVSKESTWTSTSKAPSSRIH